MLRVTGACVALMVGGIGVAQACALLASGLYNTSDSASSIDRAQTYRNQFCSKQYQDVGSAKSEAATLNLDFVQMGYSGNSSDWKKFESEVCDDTIYSEKYKGKFNTQFQTVNSQTVQALKDCLIQGGLKIWLEPSPDPMLFRLRAQYKKPQNNAEYPKLLYNAKINRAQCDRTPLAGEQIQESGWDRAGPGCLNRISAAISGASAGVRPPSGMAAG